ncbi:putative RNA-binding protein 18 [Holothuria leucospilota]|uniref:RNA-binding protein 18 n=1 Tax=Holothuria leucospilota TaxID=206669 RepID=A0A9Q1BPN2_HOLLE|nr:putative RNA-binding protein 18 [Holothuria leucospilota]
MVTLHSLIFCFTQVDQSKENPGVTALSVSKLLREAVGAIAGLNGKLALGKKIIVKWAHAQNKTPSEPVKLESSHELNPEKLPSSLGGQSSSVASKTNAAKVCGRQSASVNLKIRAIENKLKQMSESSKDFTVTPVHQSSSRMARTSRLHHSKKPYGKR